MVQTEKELIQELRDRTGLGMMDCRKALEATSNDMEKAIEILRKKGAAVASQRATKTTSQGIVHAYIHPGDRLGVMLEINCETDFVAKTDAVQQLAKDLCMHIAALRPLYISPGDVDNAFLEKEKSIIKEQMATSGKSATMIEQIIEGKINKLYNDVCLLKQQFVRNDQHTVQDIVNEVIAKTGENIIIKRFARYELGV